MVAKTDDENFVLNIIKIYRFYLFSLFYQRKSVCWNYRKGDSYYENPYHYAKIVDKKGINFLVSPHWTLLFSRKEIVKFSGAALVSVHCNCLIGCIVIARRYRLWNIANTIGNTCLLVESCNENTKWNICSHFFYQPFGCPKTNFRPLTRRYPQSPDVTQYTISSTTCRSHGAS